MGGASKAGWSLRCAVNAAPKWHEVQFRPSPTILAWRSSLRNRPITDRSRGGTGREDQIWGPGAYRQRGAPPDF